MYLCNLHICVVQVAGQRNFLYNCFCFFCFYFTKFREGLHCIKLKKNKQIKKTEHLINTKKDLHTTTWCLFMFYTLFWIDSLLAIWPLKCFHPTKDPQVVWPVISDHPPPPPTQRKFKGDHAFFVVATTLWKKQPHHIRCVSSITSFKAQLKVYVFSSSLRSLSNCHYYLASLSGCSTCPKVNCWFYGALWLYSCFFIECFFVLIFVN